MSRPRTAGHSGKPAPAPDAGSAPRKHGLGAFVESAAQEVLVVAYWFDPAPHADPHPVVVQFAGRRIGATGRPGPGDQFVQDETVEVAVPGAGPISVTARVPGVNPGEWDVTARILTPNRAERRKRGRASALPAPATLHRAAWSWRRWALAEAPSRPVNTCLAPFARVPGLVPGAWAATAVAGVVLGLVVQALLMARDRLDVGQALAVSALAVLTGIAGAKVWFMVLHRRERLMNGWCIQGLLTGVVAVLTAGAVLLHLPLGALLDASAPGLLLGMAVGRVGCFFAGCCVGRPSAWRWAVWSSDQRVGVRRIPTQLLESALALGAGLVSLGAVLVHGTADGTIFVGAAAAYTLCRQGILRLRAERRRSLLGPPLTAAAAAIVLVADLVAVALTAAGLAL